MQQVEKDKVNISIKELEYQAVNCRLNVIRMLRASGHGHVGGAMSAIDIVTALYFGEMQIDPQDPQDPDRDRFILSAGHKCLAQYAVLAEKGYFDKSVLDTYGSLKSLIPGHPDMHKLPGIEANTGALGHGLSIANGMAIAAKLKKKNSRVFVIMGDGELPEGSNWEAAAQAAKFKLDNLIVFVDYNGLQISGKVENILNMQPLEDKFKAYGWSVININGNDMRQIVLALETTPRKVGKPTVIISKTVKAKGVPMGEGKVDFHFWKPSKEDLDKTELALNEQKKMLESELKKGED